MILGEKKMKKFLNDFRRKEKTKNGTKKKMSPPHVKYRDLETHKQHMKTRIAKTNRNTKKKLDEV